MSRALLLLGAILAAQQTPAPAVSELTVAGIPVILKPIAANEVIAVRLYLKGGSANLTSAVAGIERFIGAAASYGTAKYTKDDFAARATAVGVELDTEVEKDFTVFSGRGVRDHWNETWDLFTQAALHPTFPESELGVVREQILNDLRQRRDVPDSYLTLLADSLLYADHPYAVDPAGTEASIAALTRADLVRWHRERMTKENLLLVIVGNVSRADLEAKVAAAFGALPARGRGWAAAPPVASRGPALQVAQRDLPTNYVQGIFPAPSLGDPDYAAFRVTVDLLSHRLFEEVRTRRNLSYAVYAGLNDLRANHGLLYVTTVAPDTTLKVMLGEVRRIQEEPISEERIGGNTNTYLTTYFLRQEANMGQAATLGTYELLGGGWEQAEAFISRIRAVSPADIQRVARQYLRHFTFVVIGDSARVNRKLFTSM